MPGRNQLERLFCTLVTSLLLYQKVPEPNWEQAVDQIPKYRETILKILKDDKLWTDSNRQEELGKILTTANLLADSRLAPVLIRRIGYSPKEQRFRRRPPEIAHPVYGILLRIGTPSIGPAVEELKRIAPEKEEVKLLLPLIVEIYDKGGFGNDLAIQRLELELSKTKDARARRNLENALKWLKRGPEIKGLS
jgi:hypothetical protein